MRTESPPGFGVGTGPRLPERVKRALRVLCGDDLPPSGDPEVVVRFARSLLALKADPWDEVRELTASLPVDGRRKAREYRKLRESLQQAHPDDWRDHWRELRRHLKLLENGQVNDWRAGQRARPQAIEAFRRQIEASGEPWSPFWQGVIEARLPGPHRPKETATWATVWVLRALFRHVWRREAAWGDLAEIMNAASGTRRWRGDTLKARWHERRNDFTPLDDETALYNDCAFLAGLFEVAERHGEAFDEDLASFVARILWKLDGCDTDEGVSRVTERLDRWDAARERLTKQADTAARSQPPEGSD